MTGLPRKVTSWAVDHGAHYDCIVAGNLSGSSTDDCAQIVLSSITHFYGDIDFEEVVHVIARDIEAGE